MSHSAVDSKQKWKHSRQSTRNTKNTKSRPRPPHPPWSMGSAVETVQLTLVDDVSMQWCSKHRGAKFLTLKAEAFTKISYNRITGQAIGSMWWIQIKQNPNGEPLTSKDEFREWHEIESDPSKYSKRKTTWVQNKTRRATSCRYSALHKTWELTANRILLTTTIISFKETPKSSENQDVNIQWVSFVYDANVVRFRDLCWQPTKRIDRQFSCMIQEWLRRLVDTDLEKHKICNNSCGD